MGRALRETNTYGIGEIAFSGREHLVAIAAPLDAKQKGLMLYTLRYEEELRDSKSALSGVKESSVASDELDLAKQLIEKSTSKFDLSAYKDDYESAVKKLVNAKKKGKELPEEKAPEPTMKVVNIMDALRNSLAKQKNPGRTTAKKKTAKRKRAA
jgi:DNA end-binding protein Ku